MDRRTFVLPDDVQALAEPVLAHRLLLHPEVSMGGEPATEVASRIVTEIIARVPIPRPGSARPGVPRPTSARPGPARPARHVR
jgi:MoxR-like ATPase